MNRYAIGANIRSQLDEINATQVWLSKKCGISNNHISCIVNGRKRPSAVTLYRIAKALGCSMDCLMEGVLDE